MPTVIYWVRHRVARMLGHHTCRVLRLGHATWAVEAIVSTVFTKWVLGWVLLFDASRRLSTLIALGISALGPPADGLALRVEQLLRLLGLERALRILQSNISGALRHQYFVLTSWGSNLIQRRVALKCRWVVNKDILRFHCSHFNRFRSLLNLLCLPVVISALVLALRPMNTLRGSWGSAPFYLKLHWLEVLLQVLLLASLLLINLLLSC